MIDILTFVKYNFRGYIETELEALLANMEFDIDGAMSKEYDETIANEVEMIECLKCGHQFPK